MGSHRRTTHCDPEDTKAVYLTRNDPLVHGDGIGDDSDVIQQAINKVQETTGQGILFLPEGRYRLSKTLFVWPGIRLIGHGAHRPVFVLGKNTPGYQEGMGYMVMFTGGRTTDGALSRRPGRPAQPVVGIVPPNDKIPDANPGTFYSAMSNIDFDIEDGNPAAVGIRFHIAQHCYLAHMDMSLTRNFNIKERADLQFRAEYFNIFNHTNLAIRVQQTTHRWAASPVPLRKTAPMRTILVGHSVKLHQAFNPTVDRVQL